MASNAAVTIEIWKAGHTGGTKFYHVVRFISGNGHSFALRQNGSNALYTGPGKMSTGAIALEEHVLNSELAGSAKIREKKKGGYTVDPVSKTDSFLTVAAAIDWTRKSLGAGPQKIARDILLSAEWKFHDPAGVHNPFVGVMKTPREPDEPDHIKSPEWGSW